MKEHVFQDNPIRSKIEMMQDIVAIIHCLHTGKPLAADPFIEDLKVRSIHLGDQVQQDVLMFVEQVQFQYAYDPWHKITKDVQVAADRLIEHLYTT
ncbi:MAG TPA: hypothetical protein VGO47_13390 [Chlamydiales bacterium]|jgi:hypothetical protein|nr:hypothetical protein [Chlamydiales bacterium]